MKKIIPTLFATVLAISSVSLLIGCTDAVPDDPTAEERGDANKLGDDGPDIDPDTGVPPDPEEGVGTGEKPPGEKE
jgi:hypothetical protein